MVHSEVLGKRIEAIQWFREEEPRGLRHWERSSFVCCTGGQCRGDRRSRYKALSGDNISTLDGPGGSVLVPYRHTGILVYGFL